MQSRLLRLLIAPAKSYRAERTVKTSLRKFGPFRGLSGRFSRRICASDRIRDGDEAMLGPEALGEQVAEPPDAEGLGGPVAARDEVDPGLARVGHAGLGRLSREEGVEAALDRLGEAARSAARHDADGGDHLRAAVEHERLPLERARAPLDQLRARDRLRGPSHAADRPPVERPERPGAL